MEEKEWNKFLLSFVYLIRYFEEGSQFVAAHYLHASFIFIVILIIYYAKPVVVFRGL